MADNHGHTFIELTGGLCSKSRNPEGDPCLRVVPAKVISRGNSVFLDKRCHEHGKEEVLISIDKDYFIERKKFLKPASMTLHPDTAVNYGCPLDCGLCTDHQQHSCAMVVEITDLCNMNCHTCYAQSSPSPELKHKSLDTIIKMLDSVVKHEGEPEIVQISGGEPTIHPDFFRILDEAKARPIKFLMVNTNGKRIANESGFAERLALYMPDLAIYLQFDSFNERALRKLRGEDMRNVRYKALAKLNELNMPTILVSTLQKGVNTDEIGKTIDFAVRQKAVRGINFQPTQAAGRLEEFNPLTDRYTLADVRKAILTQTTLFKPEDLVPVPCNPDSLFTGFAIKYKGQVKPLSDFYSNPADLLMRGKNTIAFEQDLTLMDTARKLFTASPNPKPILKGLSLLCCGPGVDFKNLSFENIFQVTGIRFVDQYDATIDTLKRSCVHIMSDDGKAIPFETMNMFYRTPKQRERLHELQKEGRGFW